MKRRKILGKEVYVLGTQSNAQAVALDRNTKLGSITMLLTNINHIIGHGFITEREREELLKARDSIMQVEERWRSTTFILTKQAKEEQDETASN